MALGNYPVHLSELAGYSKEELSTMLVECSRSNARMKDEIASLNQNLQNAVIYQQQREANFGLIVRSFEYTLQFRDQWIRELRAERWKQQCRLDELCFVAAFSSDDESQDDDEYLNIHKRRKMMEEHHQSSNDEAIHSTVGKESEDEEDVVHHEREKENEVEQEVEEVENEVDIEEEEDDEVEEDEEEVVEVEEDEEDEEEVVEDEEDEEEVVEVEEDEEDEEDEDEEEEEEEEEIQIHGYGICHKEVVVPMLRDISHIKDLVKSGTNFPNLKDCLLNCFTYYGLYLKFPFFCDQKSRTANEKNQTISNTRYYSCCCCRSRLFFVTIPKKEAGCTLTLLSERKHECDIEDLYTNYRDYYTNKKKAST